ncbi:MAG: chaperonin GroEL [Simkaniaceae bacterium]|nr:chaperonin GroEL [Simkaniaceae bacterium]
MAKMLQFNEKALKAMLAGVSSLAKAVVVTLGPRGRNVVIKQGGGSSLSTKDGVTVASAIILKDRFENIGAQLVKEASSKTADLAGDGTTTVIVLAEAMFREGVKNVMAGASPMSLKRGIEKGMMHLIQALESLAKPVESSEEIKQVAAISANNDPEIGAMIADAMAKVGKDGTISITEAKGMETTLEIVEGIQFDKGFLSPYFITNPEKMTAELANAYLLITDKKLSSVNDIVPILQKIMEEGAKSLLIIAEDVEGEALATLVVNKLKGGMQVVAVKAPAFGDRRKAILEDIAILTGATVVSDEVGLSLKEVGSEVLGRAKRVVVEKEQATIVGGAGNEKKIEVRRAEVRTLIANTTSDYDRGNLEERLAKLSGGVAEISLGAATETELKEKRARVEDALHATKAAVQEGIVPGGGVALLRAVKALDGVVLDDADEQVGLLILKKAAFAPLIAIAKNCGRQGEVVAEKVYDQDGAYGYNGLTDEFTDLIKAGVIDPLLVTKSALKNAASIAGLLITVACMITDKKEAQSADMPDMGGGGMPGMMGGLSGMM